MTAQAPDGGPAAAVVAERDAIQANLLELDQSFGKQVLEGATLSGQTRERWEQASAALAGLWETFLAYSAVVDRIAVLAAVRRPSRQEQAELNGLLSGGSVQLPAAPVPLARRDLAARGRPPVTLRAAVGTMRRAFTEVTAVTVAAETVWAAVGPPLEAASADLARSRPLVAGLGADVGAAFSAAESALDRERAAANADPLALWSDGRVDTSGADQLRTRVTALCGQITELDRVRAQARQRIDELAAAAAAARADREQALTARQEAATRVSPLPPVPDELAQPPLGSLATLAALGPDGQWNRLAAELDRATAVLRRDEAATAALREATAAALGRRDELRGLLSAYKAKAARLGAAEDPDLARRYDHAYGLLWTKPCDLTEATAAVAAYQRAILATEGRR